MKRVRPMTCEEFSELLLTLHDGDVVEFGCTYDPDPDKLYDAKDVGDWHFAKAMYIPEYDFRFILIGNSTGEKVFAIPLCDRADLHPDYKNPSFESHVEDFFCKCHSLQGADMIVYVDTGMGELSNGKMGNTGERTVFCIKDISDGVHVLWNSECYYSVYGRYEHSFEWLVESNYGTGVLFDEDLLNCFRECEMGE